MPNRQDIGVQVEFSRAEQLKFEKDIMRFQREFGRQKTEALLRRNVRKYPLKEARGILAAETQGTGKLEKKGLIVAKEKGGEDISFLMGGGRGRKHEHGFIAHWVELGTSGIVRDGGQRYKSGQRYRAPQEGVEFLQRSAEGTKDQLFGSLQKSIDRAFRRLGK